ILNTWPPKGKCKNEVKTFPKAKSIKITKEGKMEYTLIEKNLKWYFLKDYFPFIFRRKRCSKLNNLFQGNMSFREYASNFTQLSWDVSSIVIYPRVCMNKLM
ncbi:MAG: hypothetical protein Q8789_02495, partial [Sweet potato little leaf phytoplasma]|nr:hypothetical protein [Sweet potato little leaf phytoplasma]